MTIDQFVTIALLSAIVALGVMTIAFVILAARLPANEDEEWKYQYFEDREGGYDVHGNPDVNGPFPF